MNKILIDTNVDSHIDDVNVITLQDVAKITESTLKDLKKVYETSIKQLEKMYKYKELR